MITIYINDQETTVADGCTLADIAAAQGIAAGGAAMAVGDRVVPRAQWPATTVADGDRLIIIKAAYGG